MLMKRSLTCWVHRLMVNDRKKVIKLFVDSRNIVIFAASIQLEG